MVSVAPNRVTWHRVTFNYRFMRCWDGFVCGYAFVYVLGLDMVAMFGYIWVRLIICGYT